VDGATNALFTGDGFGIYLPAAGVLRPATPAPEFDLDLAVSSIERARRHRPSRLLFSHFGPVDTVEETCDLAIERLREWTAVIRGALGAGTPPDQAGGVLREHAAAQTAGARARGVDMGGYDFLSSFESNAAGIVRYLTKGGASTAGRSSGPSA
jgi:hypothetical protein